jgi:cyclohexadienyl dehydratase
MPAAYAKRSSKRAERPLAPRCGRAVLTALLCLSLAACAARQPADEHPLRVGTSDDYFPFSLSGAGFDVEVANAFARDHDYAIEWVSFDWPKLGDDLSSGKFDVAMSGVTWRPDRALLGRMSIAYAVGGPCWIGAERPERVGVNRGGFLERWAREYFTDAEIVSVEHNPDLPVLLAVGDVDAIVTDSFELSSFARPGDETRCLPPRDAKVYWTSPRAAPALSEQLNAWLARSEPRLQELRRTWFGRAMPRDEVDRLVDLLYRRLALMPDVVCWKRENGVPIEDVERETAVVEAAVRKAATTGLDPRSARRLFELQIELAKSVQTNAPVVPDRECAGDLREDLRPLLSRIGDDIVSQLAEIAPIAPPALSAERIQRLGRWLTAEQVEALRSALLQIGPGVPDEDGPAAR